MRGKSPLLPPPPSAFSRFTGLKRETRTASSISPIFFATLEGSRINSFPALKREAKNQSDREERGKGKKQRKRKVSHTYGLEKDGKKIRETEVERQILHKIFTPVFYPERTLCFPYFDFFGRRERGKEGRRKNNNLDIHFSDALY